MNTMIINELKHKLTCEDFVTKGIVLVARCGSYAYGANNDNSDIDMFCITVPPMPYIFPSLYGEIEGFGTRLPRFESYQQHHVLHNDAEYDVNIHNITQFFNHSVVGNPNAIDKLFTPPNCILHKTSSGQLIIENRTKFLSKMCIARFIGFAQSHLKTMLKIKEGRIQYQTLGYDAKDAAHVIRQLLGLEQILTEYDYTLDKHSALIKAIRKSEFSLESIQKMIAEIIERVKKLEQTTNLQEKPEEEEIKEILLECIRLHNG